MWRTLYRACLALPIVAWVIASYILASLLAGPLVLSGILIRRLYWSLPFVPFIWPYNGPLRGRLMSLGFRYFYCMNVARRAITLPLRKHLPSFYIAGFPKAGTTSLADHLRRHPALGCVDGPRLHPVLRKESHYLDGVLGRHHAHAAWLYRSCFGTVLERWWAEELQGVKQWMAFDACPMVACLPYSAARLAAITPNAKLIFMLRDPVAGVFSAEIMLRNMGFPLTWSLCDEVVFNDPRFQDHADELALWAGLAELPATAPLPERMPTLFYSRLGSLLRCGRYADRIEPFLQHFPRKNMMFIDFAEFVRSPEQVLEEVYAFVGVSRAKYCPLPPGMQNEYQGRAMHPTVKTKLREHFQESNQRLYQLLGRDFQWEDAVV